MSDECSSGSLVGWSLFVIHRSSFMVTPHTEIEIKLEVHDPTAVKRRLRQLGFRVVKARHFESNALFDFQGSHLRKSRCLLRLRAQGKGPVPSGTGPGVVTFKGAPIRAGRYKVRPEIETEVADGDRIRQIFAHLGLRESFRYEKYRTILAPAVPAGSQLKAELVYDETPIGDYIELEGPKRWIDRVAKQLGYDRRDYISRSYAALYLSRCHERRIKPGNMVFEKPMKTAPGR
jgi:adenylate cyclase, class 2